MSIITEHKSNHSFLLLLSYYFSDMSLSEQCADALEAMRKVTPVCHCITNYVSMDIMANVLLAIGASPIMVIIIEVCYV